MYIFTSDDIILNCDYENFHYKKVLTDIIVSFTLNQDYNFIYHSKEK